MKRNRYVIQGIVQGVGFRPFVYNLAHRMGLTGWVNNTNEGVLIEAQGEEEQLTHFLHHLHEDKPKHAVILSIETSDLPTINEDTFSIRMSDAQNAPSTFILPDLAPCSACLQEMNTPGNRRYHYPFTNCTYCGPRFSIIEHLPYDRKNTTMKTFKMCGSCQGEYDDPANRRFHAQPNACPDCGPHLEFWDVEGKVLADRDEALNLACEKILSGAILALKGVGGFQFIAQTESKDTLRNRKRRKEKPFALMYPNIALVKEHCQVSAKEEELLLSQEAPIVLLQSKKSDALLGIMLPSSPLHHLLLDRLNIPLIVTSGNRADEPICIDEKEALNDLNRIADYFLVHNRKIAHHMDDSIVRVIAEQKVTFRRARGYASLPIVIDQPLPPSLAVGGHLKNTVAVGRGSNIYISQHIGDLENEKANGAFTKEIDQLQALYKIDPEIVVSDYHPEYFSTKFAAGSKMPQRQCQHHIAHVYSCMAEHQLKPPLLGVSWDGTGYGLDHSIWGGEFFIVKEDSTFERIAHFRPFQLPCGEKGVREPRLSALGMLYEIFKSDVFEMRELYPIQSLSGMEKRNLKTILNSGFQTNSCSSAGRIFDAVSSLIGVRQLVTYEGQAAQELEMLAMKSTTTDSYPFDSLDYEPMLREMIGDIQSEKTLEYIAAKFHNTLAEMILHVAIKAGHEKVILTGGVFQNKVLTERAVHLLKSKGFCPYFNQDVPPNDGGIALGQLYSLVGG